MSSTATRLSQIALLLVRHRGLAGDITDAPELSAEGAGSREGSEASITDDARALASQLESMGPTFVKFGQLLSTRQDLLPASHTAALERLQDDVERFPTEDARAIIERELGASVRSLFSEFDDEPIAAASLAQVYRATTRSGRDVVVKVLRPDIRERVHGDMELLTQLAGFVNEHTDAGRRIGISRLLAQFRRSLADELDYRKELANLQAFREFASREDSLVIPEPIEDYSTASVLTMERLAGKKVTDVSPVERLDIDGTELAESLFRFFLRTLLVEGRLHADPHPGNLLLTPEHRLGLVDLGMVASVPRNVRSQLVKLLVAIGDGDGDESATLLAAMGHPLDTYDAASFRDEVSHLVSSTVALGSQLQAGSVLTELARLSGQHGLRPPAEMSMVGKALLNLDQVVQQLDPDFEPAEAFRSNMRTILTSGLKVSGGAAFTGAIEAKEFMEKLPRRANRVLDALADGELAFRVNAIDEERVLQAAHHMANRLSTALILAAITVAAALLVHVDAGPRLFGYPAIAIIFFLGAAVGGLVMVATIFVQDRRVRRERRAKEKRRDSRVEGA
ncbi:MAG: AarF/UbiB family protein [bacterium]|nr:AarF/UbiB family protein [bacterium]